MGRPDPAEDPLDELAEGVVLVRDGRVTRVNRAAAERLGVAPERAVGLPLIAVLRDHRLERAWRDGRPVELPVRGRRTRAVPIRGGLALRDVEEERTAQEHARRLLAVLSHELRTPLTTVRATLDALAYEDLPEATRRRLVPRAVAEADRLVRLLDDLTLDVAPPRERSVPLRELADRAAGVVAPLLRERDVRIRSDLPDATAWVDPDKATQVLVNLLENAALHGPAGGEVVLAAREAAPGWARATVRDRGAPLPEAAFESLFAPHARGATAGRGTGLGLYVVRSIAERWGGRAWGRPWRAEEGAGNEFGVLLPLRRDAPPAPED